MFTQRVFTIYMLAACLAATLFLLWLSLRATGGMLVYTLDDPYIHLALAEMILRGDYGITPGEAAAPSSSILWPFLVAGMLAMQAGAAGPLILGVAANLGTICLLAPILHRHAIGTDSPASIIPFLILPPLFLLAVNMPALPLTGMEHPVHVLAVALTIHGLLRWQAGGQPGWTLAAGIILGGLIRYEGLALSLTVLALLAVFGSRRFALVTGAVLGACLLAHVLLMLQLGLPLLPSSVLVKSEITAQVAEGGLTATAGKVLGNLLEGLLTRWGTIFALAIVLLLPLMRPARSTALVVATVATLAAHLALAKYGQFGRYEVYALTLLIVTGIVVLSSRRPEPGVVGRDWGLMAGLAIISVPYLATFMNTPGASANIYQQQYQMHRFAVDFFPRPVAVNDLGWVSWRNDGQVLDLWGLGSEEARVARRGNEDAPDVLRNLATAKGVSYAMIYDEWFEGAVPAEWCRIATLVTSKVTAASDTVAFYLIRPAEEAAMRQALAAFGATLPDGARLTAFDCGG